MAGPQVTSLNAEAEALKVTAYDYLRSRRIEPPAMERLRRLLRLAARQREDQLVREIATQLLPEVRAGLDALVKVLASEGNADGNQIPLFPVRSDLALIKKGAGAVKVETVLDEIAKLKQLRALGLPEALFRDVPAKLVTDYRQRAASEKPRELRRHPVQMRYFLLAALCWQREREITDDLIELLIYIAHHVGVRAEEKVNIELMKYVKKVIGKAKLQGCHRQPEGVVKEVIYPVVSEETIEDVILEAEADEKQEQQVKLVARSSYNHHYRWIVPVLLDTLSFQCNNERHRPVMDAIALLKKHRGRKSPVFPFSEDVPLDGVVKGDWQEVVKDDKHARAINRIPYE